MAKLTNKQLNTKMTPKGRSGLQHTCPGILNGVCFQRGRFHNSLVRWGKTSLLLNKNNILQ